MPGPPLPSGIGTVQFVYANTTNAIDLCNVDCVSDSIRLQSDHGIQWSSTTVDFRTWPGGMKGQAHSVLNFLSIIWSNYEISVHCNCIARRNCPVSFLSTIRAINSLDWYFAPDAKIVPVN